MRVDQYLPSYWSHDAIGNHVRQVGRALRVSGIDSDIHAAAVDRRLEREVELWRPVPGERRPDRLILYHLSVDSDMSDWLVEEAKAGQRVLVYYHNITPAPFFEGWLPEVGGGLARARRQMAALAPFVELALAPSHHSLAELEEAGYRATAFCPILVDLDEYYEPADPAVLQDLRRRREGGGADWLFVGRLSPNKCQQDVIAAFAVYRRLFDRRARLTLVGGATVPAYREALVGQAEELEVAGAVTFRDGVTSRELLARYHSADVFVCLSEHEGFGVPLVEAMTVGLPIVAYAAAAVPETVGAAGVLLDDKDPVRVACAVAELLGDPARRRELAAAGQQRAEAFDLDRTSAQLIDLLRPVLETPRSRRKRPVAAPAASPNGAG
ncbi:MAG TPA: glycosyltransferase family 4 protein [Acidimicrobiales bacterium]|nr:glycosyltransferase family 4 protein [Acidimicrobiales bacterium]